MKQNKNGEKKEKEAEEESLASLANKSKLEIRYMIFLWKACTHFLDCSEAASSPKDKWAFKTVPQTLCAHSQKTESKSEKNTHTIN